MGKPMTKVKKPVYRETVEGGIFSRGKTRPVIVSIEPPNVVGFRLKGTRRTYYLTADAMFIQAVKAQLALDKKERAKLRNKGKPKPKRAVQRGNV